MSDLRTESMSRKEREREQHRRDVLQVAEHLLTRKSYREITMNEIAASGEFSVGYLYKLFPSKDAMFVSLLHLKHEALLAVIDRHLHHEGPFETRLARLVQAILAWFSENMDYAASSLRDLHALAHADEGRSSEWVQSQRIMHTHIEAFFSEAVIGGILVEDESHLIARTFRAIMWGYIREHILFENGNPDWTRDAHHVVEIILKAFSPPKKER